MKYNLSNQLESLTSIASSTVRICTLGVTVAMRTTIGIGSGYIYTVLRQQNWNPWRNHGNANH